MHAALKTPIVLLVAMVMKTTTVDSQALAGDAFAAWSEPDDEGTNIYYAKKENDQWESAVRISNGGINITPALTEDSKGNTWVVWIERKGYKSIESVLKYSVTRSGGITQGRVLYSADERSYAPSIIVDRSDIPWLAWAMFDGNDEDIYYSRWNGWSWDLPQQVNSPDEYPDITPVIGLGQDGLPWITWSGYDGDHYSSYTIRWMDDHWSREEKSADEEQIGNRVTNRKKSIPELPSQAKNRLMGSVHVRNGGEIQSLSERFSNFEVRKNK